MPDAPYQIFGYFLLILLAIAALGIGSLVLFIVSIFIWHSWPSALLFGFILFVYAIAIVVGLLTAEDD